MDQETQNQIQEIIKSVIDRMGISASYDVVEYLDGIKFNIKSNEGGLLIGDKGTHLKALQHVVYRIAEKHNLRNTDGGRLRLLIDVNDYHKQRIDHLHEVARMSAQRVRYFKKEVEMKPMSAFDRRIIHTSLMEYPDITTESRGEGIERRVVIKPFL